MKIKRIFISLIDLALVGLSIYFITKLNHILATVIITFVSSFILLVIDELLKIGLIKSGSILTPFKQLNKQDNKKVFCIAVLLCSFLLTVLALIIHILYVLF